jgi:hypothetical protein
LAKNTGKRVYKAIVNPAPLFSTLHKAGILQDAHMPRDGCGGEPEHLGDLTDAEFIVFQQGADHPHPVAVSQGLGDVQCFFHLALFGLYNSLIDEIYFADLDAPVNIYFETEMTGGQG